MKEEFDIRINEHVVDVNNNEMRTILLHKTYMDLNDELEFDAVPLDSEMHGDRKITTNYEQLIKCAYGAPSQKEQNAVRKLLRLMEFNDELWLCWRGGYFSIEWDEIDIDDCKQRQQRLKMLIATLDAFHMPPVHKVDFRRSNTNLVSKFDCQKVSNSTNGCDTRTFLLSSLAIRDFIIAWLSGELDKLKHKKLVDNQVLGLVMAFMR